MSLSFGLSKDDYNLGKVYQPEFDDYQTINMGITVPILDWGNGKGQVQMAISQQKLQEVANQQIMQELEQNTITQVLEFNIQKSKVESAALSDSLAAESFELTMDRFRRGSVDVLKLVSSQQAKDNATVKFVSALSEFWSRYYLLRKLTLTDIENGEPLDVNFEELVQY
jgi:outer membrane protein TolC